MAPRSPISATAADIAGASTEELRFRHPPRRSVFVCPISVAEAVDPEEAFCRRARELPHADVSSTWRRSRVFVVEDYADDAVGEMSKKRARKDVGVQGDTGARDPRFTGEKRPSA